jgi:hypothetical protein
VSQPDVAILEQPAVVRAAVTQHVAHSFQRATLHSALAAAREHYSTDTTHDDSLWSAAINEVVGCRPPT